MKRLSANATFRDFVNLRDQANLVSKSCPLSLWITCTDPVMDLPLQRITKGCSAIFLRRAKFEVPGRKADLHNELSAINFSVERLGVQDIVVYGHSHCTWFSGEPPRANLASRPNGIELLRQGLVQRQVMNDRLKKHLISQLQTLDSYDSVTHAKQSGRLRIHGLFYLAESGTFSRYDPQSRQFVSDETVQSY